MPYKDIELRKRTVSRIKNTHRDRVKGYVLDYLKTHPCIDCGESDLVVLDFDHRNPDEKVSSVSRMASDGMALSRVLSEIEKCDVRCSNCHRKRHAASKDAYKTPAKPFFMSAEAREKIRLSKLGKHPSEETKTKISDSLKGNHCRKINDLTGKIFGRLTVLRQGQIKPKNSGTRVYWWCQCSCGAPEKEISGIKLTTGRTKSCGCLRREFYGNQVTGSIPVAINTQSNQSNSADSACGN